MSNQPERENKRIHIALPVRITQWDSENRAHLAMACTYDISPLGARVTGLRDPKVGEIVAVERGRMGKFFCRVIWVGEPNSPLHGQVGIQGVEMERTMWQSELHDMDNVFDSLQTRKSSQWSVTTEQTRRSAPRFEIQGRVDFQLMNMPQASIKNLSETGCLLTTNDPLPAGAKLRLTLQVAHYDVTVRAAVRHKVPRHGMGLEFSEIRKGDRQVLQYLLKKLTEQQFEQAFQLEM
ncbi:MAG: PilZ domain-containing protein [Candidatus Angelobacter sp.]